MKRRLEADTIDQHKKVLVQPQRTLADVCFEILLKLSYQDTRIMKQVSKFYLEQSSLLINEIETAIRTISPKIPTTKPAKIRAQQIHLIKTLFFQAYTGQRFELTQSLEAVSKMFGANQIILFPPAIASYAISLLHFGLKTLLIDNAATLKTLLHFYAKVDFGLAREAVCIEAWAFAIEGNIGGLHKTIKIAQLSSIKYQYFPYMKLLYAINQNHLKLAEELLKDNLHYPAHYKRLGELCSESPEFEDSGVPLIRAAQKGNLDLFKLLLTQYEEQETAYSDFLLVPKIRQSKEDFLDRINKQTDSRGKNCLEHASFFKQQTILDYLKQEGVETPDNEKTESGLKAP